MARKEQSTATKNSAKAKPRSGKKENATKATEETTPQTDEQREPGRKLSAREEFRKSVAEKLSSDAANMVNGLAKKVGQGNVGCAKFLWEIVNSERDTAETTPSELAVQLARLSSQIENDLKIDKSALADSAATKSE